MHSSFGLVYNNIGLMHYREEHYEDALENDYKSLEIASISLPETHSLVGVTLANIALVYANQNRFDEAIHVF